MSGKFFGDGERWKFESKGIVYSNKKFGGSVFSRPSRRV
jgi:hypothetical protein